MRFLVFMTPGADGKGTSSAADLVKYNEALAAAGILLGYDAFLPKERGMQLVFAKGSAHVCDSDTPVSPSAPTSFWMWQVQSKDEALAWASRCPAGEGDTLELRQIAELGLRAVRRPCGRR